MKQMYLKASRRLARTVSLGLRFARVYLPNARKYPLTTRGLLSAFIILQKTDWFTNFYESFILTPEQIDWFSANGWEYTERNLRLLRQVTGFPIDGKGVKIIADMRHRVETIKNDSFEDSLLKLYQDKDYPFYQHISQTFRNQSSGRQAFLMEFLSGLQFAPGNFIDIGCGVGILLGDISERYPQMKCLGIDISQSVIDHAKRIYRSWLPDNQILLINGDMRRLPFPDETFECVMAMEVLEHLPNTEEGLCELKRVVTEGGYLITSIPINCPLPGHLKIFQTVDEVVNTHRAMDLTIEHHRVSKLSPSISDVMIASRK